jgi:hypothetical protein
MSAMSRQDSFASGILDQALQRLRHEREESAELIRTLTDDLQAARRRHAEAAIAEREVERLLNGDLLAKAPVQEEPAAPLALQVVQPEVRSAPEPEEEEHEEPEVAQEPERRRSPAMPERMGEQIRPHLEELWAAHPGGLSVKAIAAHCGMEYHDTYQGVRYHRLPGAQVSEESQRRPWPTPPAPETRKPRVETPLAELSPNACKWPIGDPMAEDFGYCGQPRAGGRGAYCPEHAAVAWPGATNRETRAGA